jgi:hypothetical protein
MITDKLKENTIFVTVDGGSDGNLKKRAAVTDKVVERYKELGLRVIRFSADENHADILIPNFDEHPYRPTSKVQTMYSYPYFIMKDMWLYLEEYEYTHTIRFEWDGYPYNFDKWTDDFLDYDYLAQPNDKGKGIYLIGGMCLRSKTAAETMREMVDLDYLQKRYKKFSNINEDVIHNDILTKNKGWKNDPIYNKWWALEPDGTSFGFHQSTPVAYPESDKIVDIK